MGGVSDNLVSSKPRSMVVVVVVVVPAIIVVVVVVVVVVFPMRLIGFVVPQYQPYPCCRRTRPCSHVDAPGIRRLSASEARGHSPHYRGHQCTARGADSLKLGLPVRPNCPGITH